MTRRRKIVIATVAIVITAGAAWWLWIERLSAEERRLVGTWRVSTPLMGNGRPYLLEFTAGRRFAAWNEADDRARAWTTGIWYVEGGELCTDSDPGLVNRTVRHVAAHCGTLLLGVSRATFEITDDRITVISENGNKMTGVRISSD